MLHSSHGIVTSATVESRYIRRMRFAALLTSLTLTALATTAEADPPVIEAVKASQQNGLWRFDVTLSHPDTGWDHYADGWRVVAPDGTVLGLRVLAHPHVNEQPFTRGLTGVKIPDHLTKVYIEAKCSRDGWTSLRSEYSLK